MKKLLINSIVVFFLIQDLAYADLGDTTVYAPQSVEVSPLYASPISSGQNSGKYTIINSGNNVINYQVKNTITDNKVTVYIGYANGMFYANGILLGPSYKTSKRNGAIFINDAPLSDYSFRNTLLGKESSIEQANPLYIQAYTKFLLGDYSGSIVDCDKVISSNPSNIKVSIIKMVSQLVIDKKITPEEAQTKIGAILKSIN